MHRFYLKPEELSSKKQSIQIQYQVGMGYLTLSSPRKHAESQRAWSCQIVEQHFPSLPITCCHFYPTKTIYISCIRKVYIVAFPVDGKASGVAQITAYYLHV